MSEHPLEPIFHPRAVALVGASSRPAGLSAMIQGALLQSGFPRERIYPVNPKVTEMQGLRCYPTLLDTPDPVDHVVSLVPARAVEALVEQCVEKRVRSVHFFTAGFSETGDARMATVEREMIAKLRAAGVRTIGPNCMGLYVPESGLSFGADFPRDSGDVLLLSQSGWNAGAIIRAISPRGVRFSKAISYGNGADLAAHDFLDYAAGDPQTRVVMAYLEGVNDGRRFFEALKRCAALKPTVILKGGLTGAGARAARSHTASLAGSMEVFDALCRQAGALRVETMDELHDVVVALSTSARRVQGRRAALIGGPGGFAVLSADEAARAGLDLPPMPDSARAELHEFIPPAGTSVNNPVDANLPGEMMERAMRIVAGTGAFDVLVAATAGNVGGPMERLSDDEMAQRAERAAAEWADRLVALQEDVGVPFVGVQSPHMAGGRVFESFQRAAGERRLALFATIPRAARALSLLQSWRASREGLPAIF